MLSNHYRPTALMSALDMLRRCAAAAAEYVHADIVRHHLEPALPCIPATPDTQSRRRWAQVCPHWSESAGSRPVAARNSRASSIITSMPLPQFAPTMSAPASCSLPTASAGCDPIIVKNPRGPLVEEHRGHHHEISVFLRRAHRDDRFVDVDHRLDIHRVHAAFRERDNLLGKRVVCPLFSQRIVSQRVVQHLAGRSDRTYDEASVRALDCGRVPRPAC